MSIKKLEYLYNNSKEIKFDNKDKIVFISDVHRGDGTFFDALLSNRNIYKTALGYYFRQGFTYVEVGDGDELWKNKNFKDIAYAYENVFKILNKFKDKNRLYIIYGNHDIIKKRESFYSSQYRSLRKCGSAYGENFLKFIKDIEFYEALTFKYEEVSEKFLVTHGNQGDFMNSTGWIINRFLVRYVWKFLNGIAGFKDPTSLAKSNTKGNKIDRQLKAWAKSNSKMLLCGHTHNSRFPKKNEPPYFNDGCCVLPDSMTSIEIENGEISLIKWSVEAQDTGILWVRRKVIGGPEKIDDYLLWVRNERYRMEDEVRNKMQNKTKEGR
ncbi:metallophosphoesterase [Clostridium gasigenes]|uniref:metallophosphoesterase n=1 Tax=Clostridium gasigenes TaxID=94869 RepID=UPI001C0AF985|nr:metallophosphoesterase [Clostridium gasigenes]MBU3102789.1 metallophosphoesterase family protein [Clostridium gasigenes]